MYFVNFSFSLFMGDKYHQNDFSSTHKCLSYYDFSCLLKNCELF